MNHGLELFDLRNGYVRLVNWLTRTGDESPSRDGGTVERTGVTLVFPDPTAVMLPLGVNRKVNARLAAVEALQLVAGTFDADLVRRAAPTYASVLERPNDPTYGTYGPRLRHQLHQVYVELRNRPSSRRAVLSIWQEHDLFHLGDRPCTLTLQFLVRHDRLELITNMRSQDVWLGVPYDLFMFSQLQLSLARQLEVGVGRLTHHVGSLHLYQRDREAAGMLVMCHEDRPRPVDYPAGVVATERGDTYTEVARWLLADDVDDEQLRANSWYARQLAALRVPRAEVSG